MDLMTKLQGTFTELLYKIQDYADDELALQSIITSLNGLEEELVEVQLKIARYRRFCEELLGND